MLPFNLKRCEVLMANKRVRHFDFVKVIQNP
jgi:hypothetical protein